MLHVIFETNYCTDGVSVGSRQFVVPFHRITSLSLEANNPKVVSFYLEGEPNTNYNIKFQSDAQALHFVTYRVGNRGLKRISISARNLNALGRRINAGVTWLSPALTRQSSAAALLGSGSKRISVADFG